MDQSGSDRHRIHLPHQGTDPFFIPEDIGETRELASDIVVGDARVIPISMPSGEDVEVSPPPIDLSFIPSVPHAQQEDLPCPCLPAGAVPEDTVIVHVRHLLSEIEYSRKLAALENTAFPEHSVFSSPPLFSGFLTCFLYFHQEILKYLLTNLPVCAAAFID